MKARVLSEQYLLVARRRKYSLPSRWYQRFTSWGPLPSGAEAVVASAQVCRCGAIRLADSGPFRSGPSGLASSTATYFSYSVKREVFTGTSSVNRSVTRPRSRSRNFSAVMTWPRIGFAAVQNDVALGFGDNRQLWPVFVARQTVSLASRGKIQSITSTTKPKSSSMRMRGPEPNWCPLWIHWMRRGGVSDENNDAKLVGTDDLQMFPPESCEPTGRSQCPAWRIPNFSHVSFVASPARQKFSNIL